MKNIASKISGPENGPPLFSVLLFMILFSALSAHAATESLTTKLSGRLKKAVQAAGFKDGELGLWVGNRTETAVETYFGQNADKPFNPASLSKLVTAGAIFSELHPTFKFKTTLVSDAAISSSTLKGNLYLKGGGDPAFVSENMWFLVNEFTRIGVTSVEGDIVVDDSLFDSVRFGDDRESDRVDRAYDAPLGAMSMNWNSVSVYVRPGDKPGDKLKVFPDVMSSYFKVRNETHTTTSGKGKNVSVERREEKDFDGDVLVVSGSMGMNQTEIVFYKSISRPDIWSGNGLVEFLKQRGITVKGKIRAGVAPKDSAILATAESQPLATIVADMTKWSNNFVAEMLTKDLAAEAGDVPATMASGIAHVHKFLESLGFKKGEYEFSNVAGFTLKNRLSALQLGRVLEASRTDFAMFPEYIASLPVGGQDGTLRHRMKNQSSGASVRAKTGTLNGVVGLAGYVGRPAGSVVSFAFMFNGTAGREAKARALFDKLADLISEE
jgi:serine-type D-Ala-D-Ala carboxypeptidase/endopeptidase (penicillin-binding protein 4)